MTIKQLPSNALPTDAPTGSSRTALTSRSPETANFRGIYLTSRNWIKRTMKHDSEQAKNGRTVYAVKPALLTAKPSQMTTLVGFPTNKTMLAVLAAANSEINQAMGFNYKSINIVTPNIFYFCSPQLLSCNTPKRRCQSG